MFFITVFSVLAVSLPQLYYKLRFPNSCYQAEQVSAHALTPDLGTACYCSCFSAQEECGDVDALHGTAPDDQRNQTGAASPGSDPCRRHTRVSPGARRRHAVPSGLSPAELPLRSSHCVREGHTTRSCTSAHAAPRLWQHSMHKELRWAPEPETDANPFLMGPQSTDTANTQTDK